MPYLIILIVFLIIVLRRILAATFSGQRNNYARLKKDYEKLSQENEKINQDNLLLEKNAEETIKLYDLTQDICKTLEEDKIFDIFKNHVHREMEIGDCKFLKGSTGLLAYRDYTLLPLKIDKNTLGYLVASNIKAADTEKFYILAQQFLVGIKRAILYEKVQELTITDSLTHAFSRRYFFERMKEEFERAKKFKQDFSFLMIDIDHFKDYNDRYGHLVGDAILREIGQTIKENIRQIDFMGRYGGEELSIVLTDTDKEQALYAAQRIRGAIELKDVKVYDENLKVTISIGIATYPKDAHDIQTLIEKADEALYTAKERGRNRVCVYETGN